MSVLTNLTLSLAVVLLVASLPRADGNPSRYRYNEDEIRHEGAKEEAQHTTPHYDTRPRVDGKRPSSSADESRGFGSGGTRYRPADENVRPDDDRGGKRRPQLGRDQMTRRPSYSVHYGKKYGYDDFRDYDYRHYDQPRPVYDLDEDGRGHGPRPNAGFYDDIALYNSREPYWHAAYPPHWNYDDYRYGPPLLPAKKCDGNKLIYTSSHNDGTVDHGSAEWYPLGQLSGPAKLAPSHTGHKKTYRFRFIDNPPTDKGVTVGEGDSYYLGTDAMLQCKFPEEYKIVSNIEWRRADAPSDWLKERYATLERSEKQRSRLYIRHFDWRDFGLYQCVANVEGAFGKQSNKVMLNVVFTPDNADKYEPNPSDPDDEILFPDAPQPHGYPSSSSAGGPVGPSLAGIGNLDVALPHSINDLTSNGLGVAANTIHHAPSSDGPFADFPEYNLADVKLGKYPLVSSLDFGSANGKDLPQSGFGPSGTRQHDTGYKIHAENHQNDKIYESFPLRPSGNVKTSLQDDDEDVGNGGFSKIPGNRIRGQELEVIDVHSIGDHIYDTEFKKRARLRLLGRAGDEKKKAAGAADAKGAAASGREAKILEDVEEIPEVPLGRHAPNSSSLQPRLGRDKSEPTSEKLVSLPLSDRAIDPVDEIKAEPTASGGTHDPPHEKATPSHQKHEDEAASNSTSTTSTTPAPESTTTPLANL